jgi:hypothetical protein
MSKSYELPVNVEGGYKKGLQEVNASEIKSLPAGRGAARRGTCTITILIGTLTLKLSNRILKHNKYVLVALRLLIEAETHPKNEYHHPREPLSAITS